MARRRTFLVASDASIGLLSYWLGGHHGNLRCHVENPTIRHRFHGAVRNCVKLRARSWLIAVMSGGVLN